MIGVADDRQMKMRRPRAIWIAIGLAAGLAIGLFLVHRPTAPLTTERLTAARQLWQENGPADYEVTIELGGALSDTRLIRVQDRAVVHMETDGIEVPESAWPYWTVDGMFGFLEQELRNAADPSRTYGVQDPDRIVLQAEFDPELGYPRHFLRHVLGTGQSVEWTTVAFHPRQD